MEILQPAGWATPRGYVNGVAARGKLVCALIEDCAKVEIEVTAVVPDSDPALGS